MGDALELSTGHVGLNVTDLDRSVGFYRRASGFDAEAHKGEVAVQRRTGVVRPNWGSAGVDPAIPPAAADFLRRQRMLVLGAADYEGSMWATVLTGPPGFAATIDDRTIAVDARPPELRGRYERDVGLLAIEPWTRRRIRVNGSAHSTDGGIVVRTEQVYSNCPKYIQTREIVADQPTAAGTPRFGGELTATQRDRIARADTFFVATHAAGYGADVSHRGGNPGFVRAVSPRRLVWPDYVGNSMYMTLGNLELDPSCGLLFLDWEHGHALHLTGLARVDWDPAHASTVPGAQRLIEFDVHQVVDLPHAFPLRWKFGEYHRFNPEVP